MWAGYAFATDFRKKRGHAYMLEDQTFTERVQNFKQPGTCIHCHASVYVPYKKAGNGDLIKGFEHYNQMPYAEARKAFTHPIACIDCHAPDTMALRVTRPGFIEGIRALKASEGVKDYDVNTMATRQEMRGFVCGQCHVEYYFKGPEKRLTYPWAKGLKVDQIYEYYREAGFTDWTHAETGAPALKAQHPEFEMWNQGIHARSGVTCADCHMPYMREGAQKISDHHVRSPLLNINRACQTCHKWSEDELRGRVETIQERTVALRNRAMDALVALIADIKAAKAAGATGPPLTAALEFQRHGQFYVDFVESENSRLPVSRHAATESGAHLERPSTTCGRDSWRCGPRPCRRRQRSADTDATRERPYSEHRTQQTFQQLFERNHRQKKWRQRGERDDPQLKDRLLRERHEPHGLDHLETVRQIGKRLDVGAAHERFGRVSAAAQPLRIELSGVALRQHAVLAEARALGACELSRKHHERTEHKEHECADGPDNLDRELLELGSVKEDAIGDQAREQDPVRDEHRRERVNDIGEESQPADAVGMGRDELELDA